MMIECPRCGFAQPKDQYCASCGVNMDQLLAKPKPFMVRLLQNPNFHLSLIGALILMVVGWIFYTQSSLVSREVGRMLDLPVPSRNAGDPNDPESEQSDAKDADPQNDNNIAGAGADVAMATTDITAATAGAGDARAQEEILADAVGAPSPSNTKGAAVAQKIEISHWEFPRDSLPTLLAQAQRWPDGNAGRAYYLAQATKVLETLQTGGQSLGSVKNMNLSVNGQLVQETAPTAPEMFQFAIAVQVTKFDVKEATLRYSLNLVLPQPEPPGETGPAMRQTLEASTTGQGTLGMQGVLILLVEPPHRAPRAEYVAKAGEGPWTVFLSPEFRSELTQWLILIQLK